MKCFWFLPTSNIKDEKMKMHKYAMACLVVISFIATGCNQTSKERAVRAEETVNLKEQVAWVPRTWIDNRVRKANGRLAATDAGKIVLQAMEAHGGLERWYANGALSFRFNYQPLDTTKAQRDSYQVIDTWSNRARHTSVTDSTAHYGWTGAQHWVKTTDSTAFKYDTKFWALTPIYFLGQPFILDGEGVRLELLPKTIYKNRKQDVVKVTFDAGTGDAPDDYYILYFQEDSHILTAIRYIVSYPEYFKDGGHLPEKFMEIFGEQTVDGIRFPTGYKTYWLSDKGMPGKYITKIDVSNITFDRSVSQDVFTVPEGAKVLE